MSSGSVKGNALTPTSQLVGGRAREEANPSVSVAQPWMLSTICCVSSPDFFPPNLRLFLLFPPNAHALISVSLILLFQLPEYIRHLLFTCVNSMHPSYSDENLCLFQVSQPTLIFFLKSKGTYTLQLGARLLGNGLY